jgi:small-conductance mechanosensitive channel
MTSSVSFGVGYDSDVDRVQEILLDEATRASKTIDGMLSDPPPNVFFEPGPGDFALNYQVSFSILRFSEQTRVKSELRKLIFKRLQREGISMPFPTQTIQIESTTPASPDRSRTAAAPYRDASA